MRLDTIQAAFILEKLAYLETQTEKEDLTQITIENLSKSNIILPIEEDYERCVNHLFIIRVENREKLKDFLDSKGIETKVHYPTQFTSLKQQMNLISICLILKVFKKYLACLYILV